MKSRRSGNGNPVSKLCSRHGGRVLSISKFNCSAILTNEFLSTECSQPQPRSKMISDAAMMVWPRPPTRSRASSTIVERPEFSSARAAPRPAAPAPMMATSTSEGRDMRSALARWLSGLNQPSYRWHHPRKRMIQYSAPSRFYLKRRRLLDAPPSRGMTAFAGGEVKLRHRFLGLFRALAVVGVEEFLAQPDRLRGHLDQFVVLAIGQRLFQRHLDRRRQAHRFVLRGGADVGKLLALEDVDLEVVVSRMLADDHALVDLPARLDHHRAAVFQFEHRVSYSLALIIGDQHAVAAALDVALVGRGRMEQAGPYP